MKKRKSSRTGRFALGRFLLGLCLLALAAASVWGLYVLASGDSTGDWERVPCRIVRSDVVREAPNRFVFTATFAYDDRDGRTLESSWLARPGERGFVFDRIAERLPLLAAYAPGTEHECLVEPGVPANAVLPVERPCTDGVALGWTKVGVLKFGLFLVLAVAGGSMVLMASAFPSWRRRMEGRANRCLAACFLVLLGLPFARIGTGLLPWALRARAVAAGPWREIPATVLYAGHLSQLSRGVRLYAARVAYEYDVQGETFEGDRYDSPITEFFADRGVTFLRELAANYPKGKEIRVWVSERDPRRSVLLRPRAFDGLELLLFSLLFALVGFTVTGHGLFRLYREFRPAPPVRPQDRLLLKRRRQTLETAFATLFVNLLGWIIALALLRNPHPAVAWLGVIFPGIGLSMAVHLVRTLLRNRRSPSGLPPVSRPKARKGSRAQTKPPPPPPSLPPRSP